MTSIDRSTVRRVAKLARLELAEAEEAHLAADLKRIVDYVGVLEQLDLPAEAPAFAAPVELRRDEVTCTARLDDMLRTAPDRQGDHLRVPAVMKDKGGT